MNTCTRRDIFLQIESLPEYSPLAPLLRARYYGRDCRRNMGHELGRIPADEILQARVGALVWARPGERPCIRCGDRSVSSGGHLRGT